jgi:hypothetical protein
MKILILGNYHFKNKFFLDYYISSNYELVNNIDLADIIFSSNLYISIDKYPKKKFILGPHFSVFPNNITLQFNNVYNNAIYIQPSDWVVNLWKNEFNFNQLPLYSIPFGVNTEKFKPDINIQKKNVFIYFKNRNPDHLNNIKQFLNNKNINYKIFSYQDKYSEETYLSYLQTCSYGIWIGCHESQGFALQEALSCNMPLLVWNVKYMKEEYTSRDLYNNVKTIVSSISEGQLKLDLMRKVFGKSVSISLVNITGKELGLIFEQSVSKS